MHALDNSAIGTAALTRLWGFHRHTSRVVTSFQPLPHLMRTRMAGGIVTGKLKVGDQFCRCERVDSESIQTRVVSDVVHERSSDPVRLETGAVRVN